MKEICDIPIFHDDQHGTAVVTLAGLANALRLVGKRPDQVRVVLNGAGAAAISITKLLLTYGIKDVTLCDRTGAVYKGREQGMNAVKAEIAEITNRECRRGTLKRSNRRSRCVYWCQRPRYPDRGDGGLHGGDAIIFACANPTPEIYPEQAKAAGARVVATGRSDYPNQVNNVLAFPGIFRGTFDVRARDINDDMKIAAAKAIAGLISEEELTEEYVIPAAFDERVGKAVAEAVAKAARKSGVAGK